MLINEQIERQAFEAFTQRIQHAAIQLLGDHSSRHQILRLCEEHRLRSENAFASRNIELPLVAILGLKGQGKSWCARAMVLDENTRRSIPSGVLTREATTKLYWVGEKPPSKLDSQREVFLHTQHELLLDLGLHYVLLDTPGSTDSDEFAAKIAASATSLAPIVIFVSRHDQMRSAALATLAHRAEGSIVVPIITAVNSKQMSSDGASHDGAAEIVVDESLQLQTQRWIRSMQQSAVQSTWLAPIFIEDFEETGDEPAAILRFQTVLRSRLSQIDVHAISQSKDRRIQAVRQQLKEQVSHVLVHEVPSLANSVIDLQHGADRIPEQAIEAIMGSKTQLLIAVRNQLRTQWVAETPAIFFPYRTVLSLLAMTHGAWDRIVLALSGSLPSLFGSLAAWTRNVTVTRKFQSEMKEGLQDRINAQISLLLQPIHERFRHNLRAIRASQNERLSEASFPPSTTMRLTGVDQLQLRSSEIFAETLDEFQISSTASILCGTLGTAIFWALFAGPIVGIYRDYILASWTAITSSDRTFETFPAPSASALFTAVVLSILPVALFCMLVMTYLLRKRRVVRVSEKIIEQHHRMIQSLRSQGLLKLEIIDDELQSARFLVNLESDLQTKSPSVTQTQLNGIGKS